jgi:hypothetical protein
LNQVEKELDQLLSSAIPVDVSDFYANPLGRSFDETTPDSTFYDRRVTRQQVFQKAFLIETAADEIAREVHDSLTGLERVQKDLAGKRDQ